MALFRFEKKEPKIGEGSFVSESAEVIGDVQIGESCYIGPGAILRGDFGSIIIGSFSAIEENCIVHARPECSCEIGAHVTVGHGAIVHNAVVSDYVSIGMGAVVSNDAEIGTWSIIGEGCVVRTNQKIPAEKVAVGVPGKVVGEITEDQRRFWIQGKQVYADLAKRCLEGLEKIS